MQNKIFYNHFLLSVFLILIWNIKKPNFILKSKLKCFNYVTWPHILKRKKLNHVILTKRNIPNCFSSIIWKLILGHVFSRSFPQVWHYYIWKNFIWESKKIKKYFFHQNPVDLTQFVQFAEAAKSLRTFGLKWKTKKTLKNERLKKCEKPNRNWPADQILFCRTWGKKQTKFFTSCCGWRVESIKMISSFSFLLTYVN